MLTFLFQRLSSTLKLITFPRILWSTFHHPIKAHLLIMNASASCSSAPRSSDHFPIIGNSDSLSPLFFSSPHDKRPAHSFKMTVGDVVYTVIKKMSLTLKKQLQPQIRLWIWSLMNLVQPGRHHSAITVFLNMIKVNDDQIMVSWLLSDIKKTNITVLWWGHRTTTQEVFVYMACRQGLQRKHWTKVGRCHSWSQGIQDAAKGFTGDQCVLHFPDGWVTWLDRSCKIPTISCKSANQISSCSWLRLK